MPKAIIFTIGLHIILMMPSIAQQRYIDPIFPNDTVVLDVAFATNYSILSGEPLLDTLRADIYMPKGDYSTARHLVLMAHEGHYLPPLINGTAIGSKRDSSVVEICRRLAKLGYVAISYDYRLGWNPISDDLNIRNKTSLEALYRASQDTHALIRFLRKSVWEMGNPWSINPAKIALGGLGSGGYTALFNEFVDDFEKLTSPKFVNYDSIPPKPYLDTLIIGNIWGTGPQVASQNIINHPGYDSEVNFIFNVGGFLLDTSWIAENGKPLVSFQSIPRASCLILPPTFEPILISECSSFDSQSIIQASTRKRNQQILEEANFDDPFTQSANNSNEGNEGLFLFVRPTIEPGDLFDCRIPGVPLLPANEDVNPWDWWDQQNFIAAWDAVNSGDPNAVPGVVANCAQLASNPDMSAEKGRMYVDSIIGYLAPRMNAVLQLTTTGGTTSIDNSIKKSVSFGAYPNPTNGTLYVRSSEAIRRITVYDVTGRVVRIVDNIRGTGVDLERRDIQAGMYIIRADFDKASVTQKVMWQ